jgi:hypothetical protein
MTQTHYYTLPGKYTLTSSFLINYDGQYWYWGERSKRWIQDESLIKQQSIDGRLKRITKYEADKILAGIEPLHPY